MPDWPQVLRALGEKWGERFVPDRVTRSGTIYIMCLRHRERSGSLVFRPPPDPWFRCYGCGWRGTALYFMDYFGLPEDSLTSTTNDPRQLWLFERWKPVSPL